MTDGQITISLETGQRLFDALITSMDFGSGFLETEDVEALRALAVSIGVDPEKGTPDEFIAQYPHQFKDPGERSAIAVMVGAADRQVGHWTGTWGDADNRWVDETVIDESRMPAYAPCRRGVYGRWCAKPAEDPIHRSEQDDRESETD
jgi:hypothetical protein